MLLENKLNFKKQQKYLYLLPTIVWFFVHLFIFVIYHINNKTPYLEKIVTLFDNEWYYALGTLGYSNNYPGLYAFFPLIPFIIKIFGVLNTIILNNILSLFSLYLILYICKNIYKLNQKDSMFIGLLYTISPIHLSHIMLYTESIFLFLTLLIFLFYKSKNSRTSNLKFKGIIINIILGLLIGLCINCRSLGLAILFGIGIDIIKDVLQYLFLWIKGRKKEFDSEMNYRKMFFGKIVEGITILLSSLSIGLLYPFFLYKQIGNPFYFVNVQYEYWEREKTNLINVWYKGFNSLLNILISNQVDIIDKVILTLEYLFCLGSVILCVYCFISLFKFKKKHNIDLGKDKKENKNNNIELKNKRLVEKYIVEFGYTFLTLFIVFGSIRKGDTPFCSFYRYILVCFPIYFFFWYAFIFKKKEKYDNTREYLKLSTKEKSILILEFLITIIVSTFYFLNIYFF